jgi:6-phosphogluconolactonase
MSEVTVDVLQDRQELVERAASDVVSVLVGRLSNQNEVHLAITGGTVGTEVLESLSGKTKDMNLQNLHIWWIDERFVENSSIERNEFQARQVWLDEAEIPVENIHAFPSSEVGSIQQAADAFAIEIEEIQPDFDLVLLGMGEDGHIASIFPGSNPIAIGDWILIEKNSPKPPTERLSLSMKAINSAKEVLFTVSGVEKADAVGQVLGGESNLPAALVEAKSKTTWLIDSQAASKITSS